jgi:Holliday junction resolvasome RuvABC endonuclease subunit
MVVLTIDPASSTGYAVTNINVQEDTADIFDYGFINIDNSSKYMGDWCISIMEEVKQLIYKYNAELVTVEGYFSTGKFCGGADINYFYRAAIHILCRQFKLHYEILNVSEWKKYIAFRSTPTKEQKKNWGKEAAKKLFVQQALWERYSIKFPNFSISNKTGKPVKFCFDIVDSVAMAVYYAERFQRIRKISVSVTIPENIEWTKEPRGTFCYEPKV